MSAPLETLPPPPSNVRYALTVPQSVLFADVSLQGSRRHIFRRLMGIDYEPAFIVIDKGGRMSWNYGTDAAFATALASRTGSTVNSLRLFVDSMEASCRYVDRVSRIVAGMGRRMNGDRRHLAADLRQLWDAYEFVMATLFTFWNAEAILADVLVEQLSTAGMDDEISNGMPRFLQPYQPNYFAVERRELGRLLERFDDEMKRASLDKAIASHIGQFGFLLTPFNLGALPTVEQVLADAPEDGGSANGEAGLRSLLPDPSIPPHLVDLYILSRKFSFWKSERLDIIALADSRVQALYEDTADALGVTTSQLVCMTTSEVLASLRADRLLVGTDILSERAEGYCLALIDGDISFYEPTDDERLSGLETDAQVRVLEGLGAAPGTAQGPARVALTAEEATRMIEPGDVLVTRMTRPEFGVALERAAAFVTDEGGLLSHAAIIAREMGKPCVTATERATTVLERKMVSVDGNSGVVKVTED